MSGRRTHADEFIFLIDRLAAERENENAALRPSPSGTLALLLQFHRAIPSPRVPFCIREREIHKTITQTNVRARNPLAFSFSPFLPPAIRITNASRATHAFYRYSRKDS